MATMIRFLQSCDGGLSSISTLWEELDAMIAGVASTFQDRYRNVDSRAEMETVKRRAGNGPLLLVTAEEGGEPVGFCVSTVRGGGVGWVDSFYVRAEHRHKGIGSELFQRSLRWLRDQKVRKIRLVVTPGNEKVMDFYRSQGLELFKYVMETGGKIE